jgi:hypothetical protein
MLPQLTDYFLQFHQVHIPSIGTIRLVQRPASLDVAAKIIHPPQFEMRFSEDGWLTRHQLWYCGSQLHLDEEAARQSLEDLGEELKKTIERDPFVWNGIGTLSYGQEKLHFEPYTHQTFLQPVAAERVLRQHVQHSVLVGDQVVLSDGHVTEAETQERHRKWSQIAGWSIVILALLFILFYFYQHQFNVMASGLRQNTTAPPPPATYVQ